MAVDVKLLKTGPIQNGSPADFSEVAKNGVQLQLR